jgi:diaminopimelate decarboxylase
VSNVLGGPDAKFGVPLNQIVEAYRLAKQHGSTRFGIHMMTGSCVMSNDYWVDTVTVLLGTTMLKIKSELGIEFEFVNIGGGLGIPYRPEEKSPVSPSVLACTLSRIFEEKLGVSPEKSGIRLYMENGRFMTGPYGWLVARCHVIKNTFATYYVRVGCGGATSSNANLVCT